MYPVAKQTENNKLINFTININSQHIQHDEVLCHLLHFRHAVVPYYIEHSLLLGVDWQVTDDGTTEVTSCGSRCPSEPGSSHHHQQHAQHGMADSLVAGEMSQHERASSWLDALPPVDSGGGAREQGRCAGGGAVAEARSGGGAHDTSSRSVSYDDT